MGKNRIKVVLAVVSLLLLCSCQSTTGYYRGAVADPQTVLSLASSDVAKHWSDLYADVTYTINREGEQLDVEGEFKFAGFPQTMMARVRDFKLKFFLLDQHNRVLDYSDIAWITGTQLNRKIAFSHSFSVPDGAVAASFGYEGMFGDEEGSGEWAEQLPRKSL